VTRKTFLIDTNVLVHDATAISKFKDNDVVITLSVLEELDSLKRDTNEVGRNARDVIRYIDSLKTEETGDLNRGVTIPEGPKVRIYLDAKPETNSSFPLSLDRQSNRLLLCAYQLTQLGENVVIVSKDFVTRVKAEAMSLESQDYENLKTSYDVLYKGLRPIETVKREIDQFLKDGLLSMPEAGFRPNEYAHLTSPENSMAVCKYNDRLKKLEPLLPIPRDIWGIKPINMEQKCAIDLLLRDDIHLVTLVGAAGTGKTLLALACGMKKVFDDNIYSRILVSRRKKRNCLTGCSRSTITLSSYVSRLMDRQMLRLRCSSSWKVRKLRWKRLLTFADDLSQKCTLSSMRRRT
jgi:PhoH-like ATPase